MLSYAQLPESDVYAALERENGISLPNNQRRHRTSHAPKDVLPLRIYVNFCAPCLPPQDDVCAALKRTFPEMVIIPEFRSKSSGYSIDMRLRPQYAPLPRQSPRGGRQKSISPQGQWFSKVKTSRM